MKKILVVDDDTDILTLLQMILTMHNFVVEIISRWENISDSLVNFKPDLILLDISLNGADGRNICKNIKQAKETQHIPIILFTANFEMGINYRDWQAQDCIPKPFEISYLLKTIRSYLN